MSKRNSSNLGDNETTSKKRLTGFEPCHFPILNTSVSHDRHGNFSDNYRCVNAPIDDILIAQLHGPSNENVLKLVWALILRCFTANESASFAYYAEGSIFACQSKFPPTVSISDALNMFESKHIGGLQDISHAETRTFNSVISVLQGDNESETSAISEKFDIHMKIHGSSISLTYRPYLLSHEQATNVAHTFIATALSIATGDSQILVKDVKMISERDHVRLRERPAPTSVNSCFHHLLEEVTAKQPDALVICSWDGDLTYRELDVLSTQFACELKSAGVGPDVLVPICFNKTKWVVVAMLGILKAGGGFAPLDPSQPIERLQTIVGDTGASILVCSPDNTSLCSDLCQNVIALDDTYFKKLPDTENPACTVDGLTPRNTAYVIFTSGSTGVPKGVVIEHRSLCSMAVAHVDRKAGGFGPTSRVLQFSSYTFDACIYDIFFTLLAGACICIPSDQERTGDLAAAINRMKVDYAILTPSVVSILSPQDVPNLKALQFVGEPMQKDLLKIWGEHVCMVNGYGPTETTVVSCINCDVSANTHVGNIGHTIGGLEWVMDSEDHSKLVPIGGVGELLMEGPGTARGYLNNVEKTAEAFLETATWLDPGRQSRFYKTGDLVRYNADGSLNYLGRKDTQTKIRGQRLELGEIEYHVKKCLPSPMEVAVNAVVPVGAHANNRVLVAFICLSKNVVDVGDMMAELKSKLLKVLPGYMIPSAYLTLSEMPLSIAGKIDRKQLIHMGSTLSLQKLESGNEDCDPDSTPRILPSNDTEEKMLDIWSQALGIRKEEISVDDDFFLLGGDSLSAMRLVPTARSKGLVLAPADIFRYPILREMSNKTAPADFSKSSHYEPFSTLLNRDNIDIIGFVATITKQISVPNAQVEDILEATDLQAQSVVAGLNKMPGLYGYLKMDFKGPIDIQRLQSTFQRLINKHPIFRTVFVPFDGRILQVVLKDMPMEFECHQAGDKVEESSQKIVGGDMMGKYYGLGDNLIHFFFIEGTERHQLLMRCTQGHWDGISIPMISEFLRKEYLGQDVSTFVAQTPTFGEYMHHIISNRAAAQEYWGSLLRDCPMTPIVSHDKPSITNFINDGVVGKVQSPDNFLKSNGLTFTTLIKTAWAVVLAELSGNNDVVFGQIVTGRHVEGMDQIFAPTMAIIPVRTQFSNATFKPLELLRQVQNQYLASMPFETMGAGQILARCTNWPRWARLNSVIEHIHTENPQFPHEAFLLGDISCDVGMVDTTADVADLWIVSRPVVGNEVSISIYFYNGFVPHDICQGFLDRLCKYINAFSSGVDSIITTQFDTSSRSLPLELKKQDELPINGTHSKISEDARQFVKNAWKSALKSTIEISEDVPFFEVSGEYVLLDVAGQLVTSYRKIGADVRLSDVIEKPTIRQHMLFLPKTEF